VALAVVGEAGEGPPVEQPQPALRPIECLGLGLLIDADDERILGWVE
jgi:hypothetical protein